MAVNSGTVRLDRSMKHLSGIVRHRAIYFGVSSLLVLLVMSLVAWLVNRDAEESLEFPLAKTLASYASTLEGGTINSRAMGAAILFGQENPVAKQLAMGKLPPDAPGVMPALDMLRTLYIAEAALLVDRKGTLVAYSNKDNVPGSGNDLSFRPYVRLAMQGTPNVYPAVGSITPTRGIYLAAPLRAAADSTSDPIGAVVIKIGADKLDGLLRSWNDGIGVLLSPQGVAFAASRDDWVFRTTGTMDALRLAGIRESRQFGGVFDRPPAPLPFTLDMAEATIDGTRYAVRSLPLEWNDPKGDWVLAFMERRPPWWTRWNVLSFGGLAGLITALALFWFYLLARNAYLLDIMNIRLQYSEKVLRRSDALLKESQSIAGLGTYTLDITTGRWESSEVLDKVFGIDAAYARTPEGWLALVHPDDRAMTSGHLKNDVLGLHKGFNKEFRVITHNEHALRWVHGLGKLELDAQGRPLKMHGTIQDISERRQAAEEIRGSMRMLEEKELAKTRFLAAAGHDLRQPLAAANLFIDALEFSGPRPDQDTIIQRLKQAMATFNGLLDTLLNISKLDAGIIKPEHMLIHASELASWLDENFAPLATDKGIAFKLYFPAREGLAVRSDIGLLKSVLMNLVSNAIKFTAKGGILVSMRRRGDEALFQVWDTGAGIKPEHLEKVFDEFYQVNNPQRDRTRGLGLGLAIAKRAVLLLGGQIACRSQFERGSVFEFRLPLAPGPGERTLVNAADAGPDEAPRRAFARGRTFVVVEDDALVAQALVNLLEGLGGQVVCFHSGEEALRSNRLDHADYYIVDYMLGGSLNGIQFLSLLRERLARTVQAVLMTGDTSPSFIRDAADLHWPVLHKPVHASRLISCLAPQAR